MTDHGLPASILDAAGALRRGDITSTALTQKCLARADAFDGELGCFLTRCDESALAAAALADAELARGEDRGPLHGIPLAVKDIVATADAPTTAQSLVLDRAWGSRGDAPVVARLRAAGAVILGKTTTMEYALGMPDPDRPFPIPRNPWNLDHWTGGSSSGSANGVAARLFYGALGTDTAASIRWPSAVCGITGFKPTFGLVPKAGVVPLAWSLDHVGPMARSARDCAVLLDALAGAGYAAALDRPPRPVRVAVQRRHVLDHPFADPSAVARFEESLAVLVADGAVIEDVDIDGYDLLNVATSVIMLSEAFAYHHTTLATHWADYAPTTRLFLASAVSYTAADGVAAGRVRDRVAREVDDLLARYDVIATPTAAAGGPRLDALDLASMGTWPVFTAPWNLLGLPAISVPCGFTDSGLPVGLQLVGRRLDDATVLAVGDRFQQRTGWHLAEPEIG